jgi:hypothetical protein
MLIKTKGQKSRATVPLKAILLMLWFFCRRCWSLAWRKTIHVHFIIIFKQQLKYHVKPSPYWKMSRRAAALARRIGGPMVAHLTATRQSWSWNWLLPSPKQTLPVSWWVTTTSMAQYCGVAKVLVQKIYKIPTKILSQVEGFQDIYFWLLKVM